MALTKVKGSSFWLQLIPTRIPIILEDVQTVRQTWPGHPRKPLRLSAPHPWGHSGRSRRLPVCPHPGRHIPHCAEVGEAGGCHGGHTDCEEERTGHTRHRHPAPGGGTLGGTGLWGSEGIPCLCPPLGGAWGHGGGHGGAGGGAGKGHTVRVVSRVSYRASVSHSHSSIQCSSVQT